MGFRHRDRHTAPKLALTIHRHTIEFSKNTPTSDLHTPCNKHAVPAGYFVVSHSLSPSRRQLFKLTRLASGPQLAALAVRHHPRLNPPPTGGAHSYSGRSTLFLQEKTSLSVFSAPGFLLSGASLADLKKVTGTSRSASNRLVRRPFEEHQRRSVATARLRSRNQTATFEQSRPCDDHHREVSSALR